MKSKTEQISVTIKESDSLSIINALRTGLDEGAVFNDKKEDYGAKKLLAILEGNFRNSVNGVHTV